MTATIKSLGLTNTTVVFDFTTVVLWSGCRWVKQQ